MTTQPAPVPDGYMSPDTLPPDDRAYFDRIRHALRCGVPGCQCADGPSVHCPTHDNAMIPTLSVHYDERGFSFECTRCPSGKVWEALAKRGLMPRSRLYTSTGAVEAGLNPFAFFIQQPQDWLWPNRIPPAKLTLIAGYPSSGKTSIALDIAARVSRGAPAPDQPDAPFPAAPVVLASLNSNPKADILPALRLFGADLDYVYLADLLSPTHPIDYYPDDPPNENDEEEEDDGFDDFDGLRGTPLGRASTVTGRPGMFPLFGEPAPPAPKLAAPLARPQPHHEAPRQPHRNRKRCIAHRRPGGTPRLVPAAPRTSAERGPAGPHSVAGSRPPWCCCGSTPEQSSMARDPELQRFPGAGRPRHVGGQSHTVPQW